MAAKARLCVTDRKIYADIFIHLDEDGNGWLSRVELKLGLNNLGFKMSDQQMENLFREMDEKEDGKITFDEFLAVMGHIEATDQSFYKQAQLRRALVEGSTNGRLNVEELKARLKKSGIDIVKERLQTLVTSLQPDGNGRISIEEIIRNSHQWF